MNDKRQTVIEGAVVYVQGYEMVAKDVEVQDGWLSPWEAKMGKVAQKVVRFTGICTSDPRNDDIRGTTYDGGRYGGNATCYRFAARHA